MHTRARTLRGSPWPLLTAVLPAILLCSGDVAQADFTQSNFRAKDGTAYQLVRAIAPLTGGAEAQRVTTLAGSSTGLGSCNLIGNSSGQPASAAAGAAPLAGQALHPFSAASRTAILVPNDITAVGFDNTNGGRLTLGTGAGALDICRVGGDCPGGSQALVSLASASGGVPAACIANGIGAQCDAGAIRNVIAFGLPSSVSPPACNGAPPPVTVDTTICAPEPSDGFRVQTGQAIVFVYNGSLAGLGFDVGVAGFGIDTNGVNNPSCAANRVVSALAQLDSNSGERPGEGTPNTPAPVLSPLALAALSMFLAVCGARRLRSLKRS